MDRKGLLLINLGSPQAPTRKEVAKYLREFLCDPFVLDIPAILRFPLVHGLITPLRAGRSAAAYRKIWTDQGSPLINHTREFAEKVAQQLGSECDVRWAMRYGQPSIKEVLKDWRPQQLAVVPLYPQYAESSTRTAVERVLKVRGMDGVSVLRDFFQEPEFIHAQAGNIQKEIEKFKPDDVLLSFHGLPEHHMQKLHPAHCLTSSDCCATVNEKNRLCYRAQCFATARGLKVALSMPPERVHVSFQSRLGRRPWIKPYTDFRVTELAEQGCKRLLVSCPSFVADCLETLEEVQMRLRDQFLSHGGADLRLVPALNSQWSWVKSFSSMLERKSLEWQSAEKFP